jgi:hypothetical protein
MLPTSKEMMDQAYKQPKYVPNHWLRIWTKMEFSLLNSSWQLSTFVHHVMYIVADDNAEQL